LEKEGKGESIENRMPKTELELKKLKFKDLINLVDGKLKSKEKLTGAALFLCRQLHFSEFGKS
jgi:hypothetical protein